MTDPVQNPFKAPNRDASFDTDASPSRYATAEELAATVEKVLVTHDAAFLELAKGPEGVGPHDVPPVDLKKW